MRPQRLWHCLSKAKSNVLSPRARGSSCSRRSEDTGLCVNKRPGNHTLAAHFASGGLAQRVSADGNSVRSVAWSPVETGGGFSPWNKTPPHPPIQVTTMTLFAQGLCALPWGDKPRPLRRKRGHRRSCTRTQGGDGHQTLRMISAFFSPKEALLLIRPPRCPDAGGAEPPAGLPPGPGVAGARFHPCFPLCRSPGRAGDSADCQGPKPDQPDQRETVGSRGGGGGGRLPLAFDGGAEALQGGLQLGVQPAT